MNLTGIHFGVREEGLCVFFSKWLVSSSNPFFLTDSKCQCWYLQNYHMLLFILLINLSFTGLITYCFIYYGSLSPLKNVLNLVFPCITPILCCSCSWPFSLACSFRNTLEAFGQVYWNSMGMSLNLRIGKLTF